MLERLIDIRCFWRGATSRGWRSGAGMCLIRKNRETSCQRSRRCPSMSFRERSCPSIVLKWFGMRRFESRSLVEHGQPTCQDVLSVYGGRVWLRGPPSSRCLPRWSSHLLGQPERDELPQLATSRRRRRSHIPPTILPKPCSTLADDRCKDLRQVIYRWKIGHQILSILLLGRLHSAWPFLMRSGVAEVLPCQPLESCQLI